MVRPGAAVVAAFALFVFLSGPLLAGQKGWTGVADKIEGVLAGAVEDYENGHVREAMEGVVDAYFGAFEGEGANMEIAVRRFISVGEARRLENAFTEIRRAMHDGAPASEVKKGVLALVEEIKEAGSVLDKKEVDFDTGFN